MLAQKAGQQITDFPIIVDHQDMRFCLHTWILGHWVADHTPSERFYCNEMLQCRCWQQSLTKRVLSRHAPVTRLP